jgi:hypothetical protein
MEARRTRVYDRGHYRTIGAGVVIACRYAA